MALLDPGMVRIDIDGIPWDGIILQRNLGHG
jgi:hypothetical protein